jgi:hypothetical protein
MTQKGWCFLVKLANPKKKKQTYMKMTLLQPEKTINISIVVYYYQRGGKPHLPTSNHNINANANAPLDFLNRIIIIYS